MRKSCKVILKQFLENPGASRRKRNSVLLAATYLVASGALASVPVGTIALYSDGSVEKLLERNEQTELWEDSRYRRITRALNPLAPDLARQSISGATDFTLVPRQGDPESVFKGSNGAREEFSFWRIDKFGNRELKPRFYTCANEGQRNTLVLGRSEKVNQYSCERFTVHRKLLTKSTKETLKISYSPRLNLVVEKHRSTPKRDQHVLLHELIEPGTARYKTLSASLRDLRSKKSEGKK